MLRFFYEQAGVRSLSHISLYINSSFIIYLNFNQSVTSSGIVRLAYRKNTYVKNGSCSPWKSDEFLYQNRAATRKLY